MNKFRVSIILVFVIGVILTGLAYSNDNNFLFFVFGAPTAIFGAAVGKMVIGSG